MDIGAAVSIMSHSSMKRSLPQATLNSTKVTLQTYAAEPMKTIGEMVVQVKYGEYEGALKLYVVEGTGTNLMA